MRNFVATAILSTALSTVPARNVAISCNEILTPVLRRVALGGLGRIDADDPRRTFVTTDLICPENESGVLRLTAKNSLGEFYVSEHTVRGGDPAAVRVRAGYAGRSVTTLADLTMSSRMTEAQARFFQDSFRTAYGHQRSVCTATTEERARVQKIFVENAARVGPARFAP